MKELTEKILNASTKSTSPYEVPETQQFVSDTVQDKQKLEKLEAILRNSDGLQREIDKNEVSIPISTITGQPDKKTQEIYEEYSKIKGKEEQK